MSQMIESNEIYLYTIFSWLKFFENNRGKDNTFASSTSFFWNLW